MLRGRGEALDGLLFKATAALEDEEEQIAAGAAGGPGPDTSMMVAPEDGDGAGAAGGSGPVTSTMVAPEDEVVGPDGDVVTRPLSLELRVVPC